MSKADETKHKRTRKSSRRQDDKIDLTAALNAPVHIKRDGETKAIGPYEGMLRQHIRKSLLEKSVASIKFLLGEAEKHTLIVEPRPPLSGGVFVVPKDLPEAIHQEIFAVHESPPGRAVSLIPTMKLIYEELGMQRLMRCFNGRRA